VDVDTETGEVTVLRVRAAHDVGRAINPQSAEGQIEGGVAMGCGYATMEEVVVESGHVLTKTFVEYSIPTFLDVPRIEPILIEEPASSGPYGAKGLGEPPVCCTPAAILNAVFDATGVRMTRLPLSAENVYLALQAVGYRDGQPPDGLLAHVQRRATAKAPKGSPGGNVAVRATAQDTLAGALDLGPRELISLVGGGGKTSALCLLARELTAAGHRVIVATTTAMFLKELVGVGPLVLEPGGGVLTADLRKALSRGRVAAAAQSPDEAGKVVGLLPGTVDGLWAEGFVDYLIVEADGSRGKSLKAFGPHEPQIPLVTTTIVQVAGLDAIGNPLTGEYVHRAAVLAAALGIPLGSEVTARVFADGLREQLRRLRRAWEGSRVVTLLNKADGPDAEGLGLDVARELLLLALRSGNSVRPGDGERPDTVVLASLQEGRFARVSAIEG